MNILALDTTLAACSVACVAFDSVARDVRILASKRESMARGHAETLVPMIAQTMADTGIDFEHLDRIAVTTGPGSFTGLRVGVATARGLGLALAIPVIGVVTMDALARDFVDANPGNTSPFAVLLDARRDQLYLRNYDATGHPGADPVVCNLADTGDQIGGADYLLVGPGSDLLAEKSLLKFAHNGVARLAFSEGPSARSVAIIAAENDETVSPPSPLYLRPADAKPQDHKSLARA